MSRDPQTKPAGSYARDRFMGEALDPKARPQQDQRNSDADERSSDPRSSDPRGGGFDSQRTYADPDYGRDDTSAGGIGQHETAWQQNAGPMGVTERRYGQYGDGTSDAYGSGDASGYEGFRENHTGAPPEPADDRLAPRPKSARPAPRAKSARPARQS